MGVEWPCTPSRWRRSFASRLRAGRGKGISGGRILSSRTAALPVRALSQCVRHDVPGCWAGLAGQTSRTVRASPRVEPSKHENGGARGFSSLQVPMCLDRILQVIPLVDFDADPACCHMAEQLVDQFRLFDRIGDVVGQARAGQVQRALAGQNLRIEWRDLAGGSADTDHQAAPLEGIERRHESGLAHAVKDHGYTHPAGQFAHARGHILMTVVDRVIATVSARYFSFGVGRDRADHRQSDQFRPLRNDQSDTARCSMKQHGVARLERIDSAHQVGGGQAPHGHGCRGLAADGVRQLDQKIGSNQALGAVGAQRVDEARVGHTVADRQMGDAGTDGLDHACCLIAKAAGEWNRVGASAEVSIGKIKPHSHVADAYLSRPRLSNVDVLKAKDLGAAGFVEFNDFRHIVSSYIWTATVCIRLDSPCFALDPGNTRIRMGVDADE
ncbi:protein of unknown function [Burkholderia multivorans]